MEENNKKQWFEKLRLNSWEVEILIVGFVGGIYLISCYFSGVLKTKNFKIN